jgi:hypothetical protein
MLVYIAYTPKDISYNKDKTVRIDLVLENESTICIENKSRVSREFNQLKKLF